MGAHKSTTNARKKRIRRRKNVATQQRAAEKKS